MGYRSDCSDVSRVCVLCVDETDYDLLCRRLAAMALLKATVQLVTIVPAPEGVDYCVDQPIWTFRA